jgi:hypothetical protein
VKAINKCQSSVIHRLNPLHLQKMNLALLHSFREFHGALLQEARKYQGKMDDLSLHLPNINE